MRFVCLFRCLWCLLTMLQGFDLTKYWITISLATISCFTLRNNRLNSMEETNIDLKTNLGPPCMSFLFDRSQPNSSFHPQQPHIPHNPRKIHFHRMNAGNFSWLLNYPLKIWIRLLGFFRYSHGSSLAHAPAWIKVHLLHWKADSFGHCVHY